MMNSRKRPPDSPSTSSDSGSRKSPRLDDPPPPPPPLPSSSNDISIPDRSVPYLFAVYSFLRSFSRRVFLSPFTIEDFICALNRSARDSITDAVHCALLRSLRRHLEIRSADGCLRSTACLKGQDWNLLDSVNWPVFLLEFLYVMGYTKHLAKDGLTPKVATEQEYYALPATVKLKVLQILCDEITDSAEIREELATREDMHEEEEDVGAVDLALENSRPRRVHPRNAKTSACKNAEALKKSMLQKEKVNNNYNNDNNNNDNNNNNNSNNKVGDVECGEDGNSDDCMLCGMDGMLICCDGCPSAYHSRCIGVSKAFLPEGLWFCPECNTNKNPSAASRIARGIRGAENFGTDISGRLFLGTCNYFLVIGTSLDEGVDVHYYNEKDVPRVLDALLLAPGHVSIYADICKGIAEYWEIQLPPLVYKTDSIMDSQLEKQPAASAVSTNEDFCGPHESSTVENTTRGIASNEMLNAEVLSEADVTESALNPIAKVNSSDMLKSLSEEEAVPPKQTAKVADEKSLTVKDEPVESKNDTLAFQKIPMQPYCESITTDPSVLTQSSAPRLIPVSVSPATVKNVISADVEDASSLSMTKETRSIHSSNTRCVFQADERNRLRIERSTNLTSSFKPHAYNNQYVHGDFAASAAASLAILEPDNSRGSRGRPSDPRKAAAANVALQLKAFSGVNIHFIWPSAERKLMEVPRDRCGWCIVCKGAVTNRKGCLLNLAVSNALKGYPRSISTFRLVRHDESHLPGITAYISIMEDNLHGLLLGPFLDDEYKKQWHKHIRDASSIRVVKLLLLELEKNIRGIAFYESWGKSAGDCNVDLSTAVTSLPSTTQKRGPVGKRGRRPAIASDDSTDSPDECWELFKRGKFEKMVFQKATLPSSLVKKIARQGGCKRISGVSYSETSELPKRNRRFAWIASVEMSRNASQLALQVRYLDAHIRWRDLLRPEQASTDNKSADEASIYRNAVISNKKIVGNKLLYALNFQKQKHLPVRITKNIFEEEKTKDENSKFWFWEIHIPLYLIKEFEEKAGGATPKPLMVNMSSFLKLQGRSGRARGSNIFLYLSLKGEKPSKFPCASCKKDVSLRDAIKCKKCQGFCHKDCTMPASVRTKDDMDVSFTCNTCYRSQSATIKWNNKVILSGQVPIHGRNGPVASSASKFEGWQKTPTVPMVGYSNVMHPFSTIRMHTANQPISKNQYGPIAQLGVNSKADVDVTKPVGSSIVQNAGQPLQPIFKSTVQSAVRSEPIADVTHVSKSTSGRKSSSKHNGLALNYGLIWRKKNTDDSGKDFRKNNIVLKSKDGTTPSEAEQLTCHLCKKPYRTDLMYIRCEKCQKWYHADAVNLVEAQLSDLVGFKCCRCRRIKCPKCPYSSHYKKSDKESPKQVNVERTPTVVYSESPVSQSESDNAVMPSNNDPLLQSFGRVAPFGLEIEEYEVELNEYESPAVESQQKLSVRRSKATPAADVNGAQMYDGAEIEGFSIDEESNIIVADGTSSPQPEWDFSTVGEYEFASFSDASFKDASFSDASFKDASFDPEPAGTEETEYEPQTYFSLTELLLAPEDGQSDGQYLQTSNADDNPESILQVGFSSNSHEIDRPECGMCKHNDPQPDLKCEICSLLIHSHCSPWVETQMHSGFGQWRCGNCRDWR